MDISSLRDGLQLLAYIAVVVLAFESVLLGLVALLVLVQLWKLFGIARREGERLANLSADVLGTAAETARTVQGTTAFVGNRATRPLIELVAAVTAARRFARVVFSSNHTGPGGTR